MTNDRSSSALGKSVATGQKQKSEWELGRFVRGTFLNARPRESSLAWSSVSSQDALPVPPQLYAEYLFATSQAVADRVIYTRYKNVYVADGPVWTQSARP